MLTIKGPSKWSYDTSAGVGVGAGFVAVGSGYVDLKDPQGQGNRFFYSVFGGGLSLGVTQMQGGSVAGSLADFPSYGAIGILGSFGGTELQRQDIAGLCLSIEVSGAYFIGGTATAMLLGIPQVDVEQDTWSTLIQFGTLIGAGESAVEALDYFDVIRNSAKAFLIMTGINAGIQMGGGVTGNIGYLS
jgi:hypothetical protein